MDEKKDRDQNQMRLREPKHSALQLSKIPLLLFFYSLPAIVKIPGWPFQELLVWLNKDAQTMFILGCLIVPPAWLITGVIIHSETLRDIGFLQKEIRGVKLSPIFGFPRSGKRAPDLNPVESPTKIEYVQDPDLDTLRVEYQSLLSEAQYRDKLLLRTTYFALGAIGLFAGVLSTDTTTSTTPAVAMLASVVMLGFAIATNSYKDSRDALWNRIGRLENSVPAFRGYLTTFNTVRAMNLRLLNTISLSSYAVGLTMFMTVLTYLVYFWSVYTSL